MTKAEQKEAAESCRAALRDCGPEESATLEIRWIGGGPTSTGRSDYYDLRVWRVEEGKPRPAEWLTRHAAWAIGARFNEKREALLMAGCGYSKSLEIAQRLARLVGHPIFVVAPGSGFHSDGMVNP